MELKDKIVLITGSSEGIGKETAILFAKEGAHVVVTWHSKEKHGEEVFEECNKLKESLLLHLDITDSESIKNCVEKTIDKFGAIDILVNNSGVISWKSFLEQSEKEIDNQIDVNYRGLVKMVKSTLPYMKGQNSGLIINISSGAGKSGFSGLTTYCGTKFAVRGFTQAMKQELPREIKICSVNPGLTATKMTNFSGVSPRKVAEIILKTASGEIKPDNFGDVDVWKFSFDAKVSDAVFGAKKKIKEIFSGKK